MIRFYIIVLISSFVAACSTSESNTAAILNVEIPVDNHLDAKMVIELDTFPQEDTTELPAQIIIPTEANQGYKIKYLAVHCTASPPSQEMRGIHRLDWWKKARGWRKWGYHVVFFRDGSISILNPNFQLDHIMQPNEMVYGVRGLNRQTISIAYIGGVAEQPTRKRNGILHHAPEDNMTDPQYYAMRGFLQAVQSAIPDIQIGGHRDFIAMKKGAYKACPSFDVAEKFADIIDSNNLLKF